MNRLFTHGIVMGAALTLLMVPPFNDASAHDTWITMQSYTVEKSKQASYTVANAHKLVIPDDKPLSCDQIETAFILAPDGKETACVTEGTDIFKSAAPVKTSGTYLAVAKKKGGFSSKTPDGYQRGKNKQDVKNVVECSYSEKYAKAVFAVGAASGNAYAKVFGHPLEIVPMQDPAGLKKGDALAVQVLAQGQPVRAIIYGTYEGFSPEANAFAYTTSTDKQGMAKIRMIGSGVWLLVVKQDSAYPDAAVCDKKTLAATLTFKVK